MRGVPSACGLRLGPEPPGTLRAARPGPACVLLTLLPLLVASTAGGEARPSPRSGAAGDLPQQTAVAATAASAADEAPGLFDADSTLEIALAAPWRTLLRRRDDRPTVSGTFSFTDVRGTRAVLDLRIRVRGKWRLENCALPPLTLELSADQIAPTELAGQTVLHASTPCRPGKKWEQHLLEEYLIYRMYGVLTEASLGARLVSVEYVDTEGRKPPPPGYLFLVEDIGLAAARLGRRWLDEPSVGVSALEPDAAALFGLFQFMIGNTDFSSLRGPPGERCCHNAALLGPPGAATGLLLMPFDFDASGLVDTGEIPPDESLPIHSVRQRVYRGLCAHNHRLEGAIGTLQRARSEILALWQREALLTASTRAIALRYLEDFFLILDDPKKLQEEILGQCRG